MSLSVLDIFLLAARERFKEIDRLKSTHASYEDGTSGGGMIGSTSGGATAGGGYVDHSSSAMPDIDALRITSWAGALTLF